MDASAQSASPNSVPVTDPVYAFLDRMEVLGFVHDLSDGVKPFSRGQVAAYLKQIAPHRTELTAIDQRRLDDYMLDYRWDLNHRKRSKLMTERENWYSLLSGWPNFKKDFKRFFRQNQPEEENHVFMWETDSANLYLDYEQGLTYEQRSDNVWRSASWQKYRFRGVLANNFGYSIEVQLHGIRGDEAYALQHPILKNSYSHHLDPGPRYSDRSGGELFWHTPYMDIQFAQHEVEWGYGESGKLILSRNPEQYPYLALSKDWGWIKFIALHGKLQSFPQDTLPDGQQLYPDKWLAAHRLEVSLWRRLTLGFSENFIYGNRYADWAYLIPFNFYRAVQHKLRDRDNATISVDAEYLPFPGLKLYGTVFLDEFKTRKIGTDWFGNKHAFQGGLFLADPFNLPNVTLRYEYTAIMPWVYTHKYKINSYTSDKQSLGYWAGPNSEVHYFHLQKYWHQRLRTGFIFRQWKHGANYPDENIGGDILVGHGTLFSGQTEPRETRKFLEGVLTTEKLYRLQAQYEVFNDFYLSARYSIYQRNTEGQKSALREFYVGAVLHY